MNAEKYGKKICHSIAQHSTDNTFLCIRERYAVVTYVDDIFYILQTSPVDKILLALMSILQMEFSWSNKVASCSFSFETFCSLVFFRAMIEIVLHCSTLHTAYNVICYIGLPYLHRSLHSWVHF